MSQIFARMIADSVAPHGARMSTLLLRYPRFIHGEFMTHRAFSRNASSSRAVPVRRGVRAAVMGMAMPAHIGRAQAGMQADRQLAGLRRLGVVALWRASGVMAAGAAWAMARLGAHKQVANRVIEPWSHISVVCTATCFENFLALRAHPMAQPEMQVLAAAMREALAGSSPRPVAWGGWHLPFVGEEDLARWPAEVCAKLSVARCARVSYLNHEGTAPGFDQDMRLYRRLMEARPQHASPAEHQALACRKVGRDERVGNLSGWRQHRSMLEKEAGRASHEAAAAGVQTAAAVEGAAAAGGTMNNSHRTGYAASEGVSGGNPQASS